MGYKRKNNRLHGRNIPEPDLGYIQSANHMSPSVIVSSLERPIFTGTQLTPDPGSTLLRLTFSTKPGPRWNSHDTVTG